jgi:hypothetical protein
VLDGEVAVYDEQLRSRFEWLREPDPDAVATPPMYIVFDLLHHNGRRAENGCSVNWAFTRPMLSHRVVVLHEGEVIAEDNPNEAMREQRVVDVYLGRPHVVA